MWERLARRVASRFIRKSILIGGIDLKSRAVGGTGYFFAVGRMLQVVAVILNALKLDGEANGSDKL